MLYSWKIAHLTTNVALTWVHCMIATSSDTVSRHYWWLGVSLVSVLYLSRSSSQNKSVSHSIAEQYMKVMTDKNYLHPIVGQFYIIEGYGVSEKTTNMSQIINRYHNKVVLNKNGHGRNRTQTFAMMDSEWIDRWKSTYYAIAAITPAVSIFMPYWYFYHYRVSLDFYYNT